VAGVDVEVVVVEAGELEDDDDELDELDEDDDAFLSDPPHATSSARRTPTVSARQARGSRWPMRPCTLGDR
jgi:hypothetical protein